MKAAAKAPGKQAAPVGKTGPRPEQPRHADAPSPGWTTLVAGGEAAGAPLDGATRSRMEQGFGRSLPDIHVHTDAHAAAFAATQSARAVAVGSHVGFAEGQPRPGTIEGDLLLAHELAHVQQQRGEALAVPADAGIRPGGSAAHERVADLAAARAVARSHPRAHVEPVARRALGPGYGAVLDRLAAGPTQSVSLFSPPRLQRCDVLNPPEPHLQTDWDTPPSPAPAPPESFVPSAPIPERTPEEETQARAAEVEFALRQVWSTLNGIREVGAEVELSLFVSNGAVTLVSWRRTAEGGSPGVAISEEAFRRSVQGWLPYQLTNARGYLNFTLRRESARWVSQRMSTEVPAGIPAVPPEARTVAANISGYSVDTFGEITTLSARLLPLLRVPRGGTAELVGSLELENERVVRWSPESYRSDAPHSGSGTVAPPEGASIDVANALLPLTTGIGQREVRITLRGRHDASSGRLSWSVAHVGVVRATERTPDEAEAIVAEYRNRHQEIMRRWREGVRDMAVYAGMLGVREVALWVITGGIFRIGGFVLGRVAPRIAQILGRGARAQAAGWFETLVTRLPPAEREALARLVAKVETQGARSLSAAERTELERIFRRLDDLVEAPLTTVEKRYLRSAMHGRIGAAKPAVVEAFASAARAYQVHHRVPLEYAHLFPRMDINAGANLLAIETTVHQRISAVWTRFRTAPSSKITNSHVERVAGIIDRHFRRWYDAVPSSSGAALQTSADSAKAAALREVDRLLAAL